MTPEGTSPPVGPEAENPARPERPAAATPPSGGPGGQALPAALLRRGCAG
ncbi:MAG: hypothetical protein ACLSAF_16930 [Intestinimonas sp.]